MKLQYSGIHYQTQVEIPITKVDFYFLTTPRPTLVFVDGNRSYSDKKRDELYQEIVRQLGIE